ncbi:hypothetical protein AAY473_028691 [Plecturocebus cupreus]
MGQKGHSKSWYKTDEAANKHQQLDGPENDPAASPGTGRCLVLYQSACHSGTATLLPLGVQAHSCSFPGAKRRGFAVLPKLVSNARPRDLPASPPKVLGLQV